MNEYFEMMSYTDRNQADLIYSYVGRYGKGKVVPRLEELVQLHFHKVQEYNFNTPVA
jgi:hypothetical protein